MESDHDHHPTSEKPNDGDDQQGGSKVITRSYECNFCKRGFSNAQALGGHMNIHRKDKVKLKQTSTSNQTQPSLDNNPHQKVPLLWPWNESPQPQGGASSRDETHVVHIRQLPLFAGSPIITSETQKPQDQVLGEITTDQSALTSGQGSSSELDLELRLGPDPEDSSATTGTRKFF